MDIFECMNSEICISRYSNEYEKNKMEIRYDGVNCYEMAENCINKKETQEIKKALIIMLSFVFIFCAIGCCKVYNKRRQEREQQRIWNIRNVENIRLERETEIIIINHNIIENPEEIKNIKVVETIKNGNPIYQMK